LNNSTASKDDHAADSEDGMVLGNGIEHPECPEQWEVSTAPNVARLIRPTQKSNRQAEKVFLTIIAIETKRNNEAKTMYDRMHHDLVRAMFCAN